MPIYMRIDGIKGDVQPAGGATGGVWKTSNFLTADQVGPAAREPGLPGVTVFLDQNSSGGISPRPKIKTYICPSTPGVVQISRISLTPGGGIEGRDPAAKVKVEHLLGQARSQGPNGRLYIATDTGVFASTNNRGRLLVGVDNTRQSQFDGQGRLVLGTEGGVWRSGPVQEAARRMGSSNNLRQIGLGCHNSPTAEIIVTDPSGMILQTFQLRNVSISSDQSADSVPQRSRVTSLTVTFSQMV